MICRQRVHTCIPSSFINICMYNPGHGQSMERWTKKESSYLPSIIYGELVKYKKHGHTCIPTYMEVCTILVCTCMCTQGSIEEKIYQRQICKSGLAEIMDSGDSSTGTVKFSWDELKVIGSQNIHVRMHTHTCIYIYMYVRTCINVHCLCYAESTCTCYCFTYTCTHVLSVTQRICFGCNQTPCVTLMTFLNVTAQIEARYMYIYMYYRLFCYCQPLFQPQQPSPVVLWNYIVQFFRDIFEWRGLLISK